MHNWIPVLVFAGVALIVYRVLIPRRRSERHRSTDGGDGDFSSSSDSGGGWSFGDLFGSSSESSGDSGDSGGSDGGGGGDGGGGD